MALSAGTRLGPYEILEPLGAGGMGEVYRATDTKLGREVAIKTLPPEVTGDSERLARFQREAHLLASLNHPNIAAIHGLEEADGKPFLARVLIHVPESNKHLVHFYGAYAHRVRATYRNLVRPADADPSLPPSTRFEQTMGRAHLPHLRGRPLDLYRMRRRDEDHRFHHRAPHHPENPRPPRQKCARTQSSPSDILSLIEIPARPATPPVCLETNNDTDPTTTPPSQHRPPARPHAIFHFSTTQTIQLTP